MMREFRGQALGKPGCSLIAWPVETARPVELHSWVGGAILLGPAGSWPCFQLTLTSQCLCIGSISHFGANNSDIAACPVSLGNHGDPIIHF